MSDSNKRKTLWDFMKNTETVKGFKEIFDEGKPTDPLAPKEEKLNEKATEKNKVAEEEGIPGQSKKEAKEEADSVQKPGDPADTKGRVIPPVSEDVSSSSRQADEERAISTSTTEESAASKKTEDRTQEMEANDVTKNKGEESSSEKKDRQARKHEDFHRYPEPHHPKESQVVKHEELNTEKVEPKTSDDKPEDPQADQNDSNKDEPGLTYLDDKPRDKKEARKQEDEEAIPPAPLPSPDLGPGITVQADQENETEPGPLEDLSLEEKEAIDQVRTYKRSLPNSFQGLPNRRKPDDETGFERFWTWLVYYFDPIYVWTKRIIYGGLGIALLLALVGGIIGYAVFHYWVETDQIPSDEELVAEVSQVTSVTNVFYANQDEAFELNSDLKRTPVNISDMSLYVLEGVIATEDPDFFDHNGFSPKATIRAGLQQVTGTGDTGGSTLTQQLVKQQVLTDEVSFERKATEIVIAQQLEDVMPKGEILENYMNVSPFGRNNKGENIAGIEEAAQGVFGMPASDLNYVQAAYLAGLPKSPIEYTAYDQYGNIKEDLSPGFSRKNDVLFYMYSEGYITYEEMQAGFDYDLTADFLPPADDQGTSRSYLYDEVEKQGRELIKAHLMEEDGVSEEDLANNEELGAQYEEAADFELRNGGYNIHTTIHQEIHDAMGQIASDHASYIGAPREVYWIDENTGEEQHITDYAQNGSVLIDNQSGAILAFVGGVNFEENQLNHAFHARRSPASVIKPFVAFGPAIDQGIINPSTPILDKQLTVTTDTETWVPTNAGDYSNRWMSARESLARSQNIPAARIYLELLSGGHEVEAYARNAGLSETAIPSEDFANPSLVLGGVTGGVTVAELTSAFSTFANDGTHMKPYLIASMEDANGEVVYEHPSESSQAYSEQTAYILQDMLREVTRNGTATSIPRLLEVQPDLISKSGTSDNQRDVWYIGSTPNVTLGSWIGYSNLIQSNNLATEGGEIPSIRNYYLWAQYLNRINQIDPELLGADQVFNEPADMNQEEVLIATGTRPGNLSLPNNQTMTVTGETRQEYFAPGQSADDVNYRFSVSTDDEDYADFWAPIVRRRGNIPPGYDPSIGGFGYWFNRGQASDAEENESEEGDNPDEGADSENTEDEEGEEAEDPSITERLIDSLQDFFGQ